MTKPIWTAAHQRKALKEGWCIITNSLERYELQRDDSPDEPHLDGPVFDGDDEAWVWVFCNDEPHHRAARFLLAQESLREYLFIARWLGLTP